MTAVLLVLWLLVAVVVLALLAVGTVLVLALVHLQRAVDVEKRGPCAGRAEGTK
ncbi:hypothetical protein ACFO5K_04480 [Nocardia halotolerans]|uniref:Uncharacterized protein n=1 Tax=Nocardia halotolerans TaxID=1755878 RepID=A0ABV8VCC8_9NOCA